jgi:hypothetical protein
VKRDILRTAGVTLAVAYGLFLLAFPLVPSEQELEPVPPPDAVEVQRDAETALATRIRLETLRLASVDDWGWETAVDVPTDGPCTDAEAVADLVLDEIAAPVWDGVTVTLSVRTSFFAISWSGVAAEEKDQFATMLDVVCALPPEMASYASLRDGLVDLYPPDPGAVSPEMADQARTAIFDAGLRPTVWAWEFQNTFAVPVEP